MEVRYDNIGIDYNLTRKADKYLTERLLNHLNANDNGLYLDIGCGTGNYTNALQKKGFNFIGIDPSTAMLENAIKKNQQIDWRIGAAEKTGLNHNSVDGIIGVFSNLTKAYEFIYSGKIEMTLSKVSYSTIAGYLNPKSQGYFVLDNKIGINKYTVNHF